MKKLLFILLGFFTTLCTKVSAHQTTVNEKYGKSLNLGVGLGYYGYVGHPIPVLHADFELDVARNFTLAPFITYYSYQGYNYWGDGSYPYKNYYYRETALPIGLKGSYYFDQLFGANSKWDFYAAGSLGVVIRKTIWDSGYYGKTTIDHTLGVLYVDFHAGAEYHIAKSAGLFLDLSTGVSTLGLGIHF
jgi:hypothetical protein